MVFTKEVLNFLDWKIVCWREEADDCFLSPICIFSCRSGKYHTTYAYTWVYSPIEQKVGLNIDFQNYSRSESDLPPLPGTWDYKGSRIWLNKEEILPSHWINNHKERSNEIALVNENSASRPPITVTLNKGWNKIFIKLPVGRFQSKETRLVKWMFNVVFVSIDGKEELKNIVYSTDNPYKN